MSPLRAGQEDHDIFLSDSTHAGNRLGGSSTRGGALSPALPQARAGGAATQGAAAAAVAQPRARPPRRGHPGEVEGHGSPLPLDELHRARRPRRAPGEAEASLQVVLRSRSDRGTGEVDAG